ncbi:MAG: hypothetical protein ACE5KF_05810 [Kiloniellaceae bacterium]
MADVRLGKPALCQLFEVGPRRAVPLAAAPQRPQRGLLTWYRKASSAAPALACRGTTEFPEAFKALEALTVAPERKTDLREQLSQGAAMHEDAHRQGDKEKMSDAIRIFDAIKPKIAE